MGNEPGQINVHRYFSNATNHDIDLSSVVVIGGVFEGETTISIF